MTVLIIELELDMDERHVDAVAQHILNQTAKAVNNASLVAGCSYRLLPDGFSSSILAEA